MSLANCSELFSPCPLVDHLWKVVSVSSGAECAAHVEPGGEGQEDKCCDSVVRQHRTVGPFK